jgi:hypothetical protein
VGDGVRAVVAGFLVLLAAVLAAGAHDVLAWRHALRGANVGVAPTWLPGDPVRSVFGLGDDLAVRRAVRSFRVAYTTGRGFDNGVTRTTRRSLAEVRLTDVAAHGAPVDASQAGNLLGVLVVAGGRVTGGITADDRARSTFEAAIRRDTENTAARYNLELLLRRTRATATRQGPGNGSGALGHGRRGAGSGTPGRGY